MHRTIPRQHLSPICRHTGRHALGRKLPGRDEGISLYASVPGYQTGSGMTWRDGQDEPSRSIEIKFGKMANGRKPNRTVKTMMGQCLLASTRHDAVIGVFGYKGSGGDQRGLSDKVEQTLARHRIWVIARQVT